MPADSRSQEHDHLDMEQFHDGTRWGGVLEGLGSEGGRGVAVEEPSTSDWQHCELSNDVNNTATNNKY